MPWYEDWFDRAEYERVYQRRDEDEAEQAVDLVERVAEPAPGAKLLDVGCGRGRHARAFARRGYRVTGIDLSEAAIRAARRRAADEGLAIDFRRQDMREPMGREAFDGAVNLFSSFGYFEEERDHQRAIDVVAQALRPPSGRGAGNSAHRGGFFVQDFMNAAQVRATLVPESTRTEDDLAIEQKRWIENGRIEKDITLRRNGSEETFHESVRLLALDDFRRLYTRAGLHLEDTFGNYDGAPHDESSPRLILLARHE